MGRTYYTCNINKDGLLHLLRHASPRLPEIIISDNPSQSLLYHFLIANEKKFSDLKNDSIKLEDNLISLHNTSKVFVDQCPDINILHLLKSLSNVDIFHIFDNLIATRAKKPHIVQAATILLAAMSLTEYSQENFDKLKEKLSLHARYGFQVCLKWEETTDYWINELSTTSPNIPVASYMAKKRAIKLEKIVAVSDDGESYDSDESIPVFHPVLTYAELSDEAEEEQSVVSPVSTRPKRKCAKIDIKKEMPRKVKKVNLGTSDSSSNGLKSTESPCNNSFKAPYEDLYYTHKIYLPQFHYPIRAPSRTAYSRWEELPFDNKILPWSEPPDYDGALEKFRVLRDGTEIPHASTLIVGDSILAACNFEEKLDSTVSVMISFPNKAKDFANFFIQKVKNNGDSFSFQNIVIGFGIEFVCYDPDEKAAVNAARKFIIDLLEMFHEHFLSKPLVRFILLTIPHVNHDTTTLNYSHDVDYFNKQIRKFVEKYKDEIKEKRNINFCLFDWEREAASFREPNVEHVSQRYEILLNEIAKYTSVTDK